MLAAIAASMMLHMDIHEKAIGLSCSLSSPFNEPLAWDPIKSLKELRLLSA